MLAAADIEYRHRKELAPTSELRQLQYRKDDRQGVGKRSRTQLAREYRERYIAEILDRADLDAVVVRVTDRPGDGADVRGTRPGGLPPLAGRQAPRR